MDLPELFAVERLVSGLVHDLNNALAGIVGYAQLARDEDDAARRQRYLDVVVSQAEHIRSVVTDLELATCSRPVMGSFITARDIVDAALMSFAGRAPGVSVAVSLPPRPVQFEGELDVLARAVGKLLDNAVIATPKNTLPSIEIVAGDEPAPFIDVIDHGVGMTPELAAIALDPTVTTRRTGNGIGLGLAAARTIMHRHGGTVSIESQPGETRVRLQFPSPP
jgi:signal transduction histidine kinase